MSTIYKFTTDKPISISRFISKLDLPDLKINYPEVYTKDSVIEDALDLIIKGKSIRGIQVIKTQDNEYNIRLGIFCSIADYKLFKRIVISSINDHKYTVKGEEGVINIKTFESTYNDKEIKKYQERDYNVVLLDMLDLHKQISFSGINRNCYIDDGFVKTYKANEFYEQLTLLQNIGERGYRVPTLLQTEIKGAKKVIVVVPIEVDTFIPKSDIVTFYTKDSKRREVPYNSLKDILYPGLTKIDALQYVFKKPKNKQTELELIDQIKPLETKRKVAPQQLKKGLSVLVLWNVLIAIVAIVWLYFSLGKSFRPIADDFIGVNNVAGDPISKLYTAVCFIVLSIFISYSYYARRK